ncbi:MAG: ABC transporter permease [Acidobacteria bacterium]|nr:ABC transporter permease [Acidobacteriota bacterium]MBI3421797.1 ABC transporter permease [Acidobacteriota bacterium]
MFRHLPLIFKNSLRNRRRSLLTIISIAASLCLLGTLLALYNSFFHAEVTPDQALRLITRNRISLANPLPLSYQAQIKQVPGVKEAMIFQWFGGTYKDARDPANFFARFAIEGDKLAVVNPEYKLPDAERAAFLQEQTACIVGRKTATRHNMKVGDHVALEGDAYPIKLDLVIRGIYDCALDNETLFFHYKYLNESVAALPAFRDVVATFTIRLNRIEDSNAVAKAIDDKFHNAPVQTKTETEQAFALSFVGFLGNVKLILLSICAAVTFTILLVSGNTMAMAVRERVREVGVLKTLGYTNSIVLLVLVGEAVLISLIGGALGLLLTSGLLALLRTAPSTFVNTSQLTLPLSVTLLCLLIAVTIGVVSSIVPAWGASRRSIVEALRFTD